MSKILLLGAPASGKGTAGKVLAEELGLPIISGGALLRDIPESDSRYEEFHKYMDKGELVPDDMISEIYKNRLDLADCANGYVLDGWARSMEQVEIFDPGFDHVLFIKVSDETVIKRISGRRLCEDTGETFNIYTYPPEELKKFENCKNVIQREDDTEETAKNRLKLFHEQTMPVIDHYRDAGILIEIDGEPLPKIVASSMIEAVKARDNH